MYTRSGQEGAAMEYIDQESATQPLNARSRYCCFPTTTTLWWDKIKPKTTTTTTASSGGKKWWYKGITALKKFREWSELVAGPKWKTFIRKFNRPVKKGNFHYDPLSYALNFDDGQGHNGDFDDCGGGGGGVNRDFSARYASAGGGGGGV